MTTHITLTTTEWALVWEDVSITEYKSGSFSLLPHFSMSIQIVAFGISKNARKHSDSQSVCRAVPFGPL